MAKQRVVNTRFWDDDFIVDLDPIEKLVFLYVLTNPLTDLCGAYEITLKRIAFDTGIDKEMILKIFARFEKAGKIVYRNGWLVVRNFAKHQVNNPNVSKGIARSLSACPDWVKDSLSKPIDSLSTPTLPKPEPIPEPEPSGETPPPKAAATTKKATRIPDPFLLTSEMKQWSSERRPLVDPVLETEKFVNYWRAKSGRDGTKLDWLATWKNWILNSKDTHSNGTNSNGIKPTNASRIEATREVISQYPSQADIDAGRIG